MARVQSLRSDSTANAPSEARPASARDLGVGDATRVQAGLDCLFALRDEDPALQCLEHAARAFHEQRAAEAEAKALAQAEAEARG